MDPGLAVTPDGSPCSVILTKPVNPFCGATETVIVKLVCPTTAEAERGETERVKSGITGGGVCWVPPPHPMRKIAMKYVRPAMEKLFGGFIESLTLPI